MILKKWEDLPEQLKTKEVRPYYEILSEKKASLFLKRVFDIVRSGIMLVLLRNELIMYSLIYKH